MGGVWGSGGCRIAEGEGEGVEGMVGTWMWG